MSSSFHFEKAYVDITDESGNWWIGYDAQLSWGPVRLNYREIGSRHSRSASQLRFGSRKVDGDSLVVDQATLCLSGGLPGKAVGYRNEVLGWQVDRARADVRIIDGDVTRYVSAAGYGETVVLRAPPWELGIRELHWGRYLSPTRFLTWIVANGERPIRFGVVDEKVCSAEVGLKGCMIQIGGCRVELKDELAPIADGNPISSRAWPIAAIAKWVAPSFSLVQRKAVFRARVTNPDERCEDGLAIAEQVVFTV